MMFKLLDDKSVAQLNDSIPVSRVNVRMRDLNDRRPTCIQLLEHLHDLLALARMQVPSGFISQDEFWICDHSASYTNELLLATGKLARIEVLLPDDAKAIERVAHNRITACLVYVPIRKRYVQVLIDGEVVEQMVVLENKSDFLVAQGGPLFRFQGMDARITEVVFAAPGMVVHAEDMKERRLARAGWAHDGNEVAFVYLQVNVAQDVKELSVRKRIKAFEVFKGDHRDKDEIRMTNND